MMNALHGNTRRFARRRFVQVGGAGAIGAAAFLAACKGSEDKSATSSISNQAASTASAAAGEPKRGGTLRLPIIFSSGTFDIHQFVIGYQNSVWRACSNSLVALDRETGNPIPDLAESWNWEDPLNLVLKLRKDAKFHDKAPVNGRAVTAADVKFSLERIATKSPEYTRNSDYADVDRVEAVDPATVKVVLKRPYAPLINLLPAAVVVPPEVVQKFGDLKDSASIIGSGPFMADKVDGTTGARVVRNPNYWEPNLPYLDAVQWTIVNDTQTSLSAFRAGNFDLHDIAAIDLPSFKGNNSVNIAHFIGPSFMVAGLGGPIDVAPLNDMRIRQAIDLTINREELGAVVFPNGDFKLSSVFGHPEWSIPNDEIVKRPGFGKDKAADMTQAKQLLQAAGQGNGLTLTVSTTPQFPSFHLDRAQVYRDQLAKVGITLQIDAQEYTAYKDKERSKRFQLSTGAWAFSADPDAPLSGAFVTGGARNYFNFSNPAYDAIVEKQRQVSDLKERKALVLDAQRMLLDLRPVAAFNAWFAYYDVGLRKEVRGAKFGAAAPSGSNAGDQGPQAKFLWLDR